MKGAKVYVAKEDHIAAAIQSNSSVGRIVIYRTTERN